MFKWPWLLITMASHASPGQHEIMDSFLCENAHWLFVLMKSPSRSFKIRHLWTACVLWLWHLLSSFHSQLQLFQPASKSVNLCILFREQSKDSQSRLPCQHSSQSAQPTLEFFRNLLVWSLKVCLLRSSLWSASVPLRVDLNPKLYVRHTSVRCSWSLLRVPLTPYVV